MPSLVIVASGPLHVVEGRLVAPRKFVDGLDRYATTFPGPVAVVGRHSDTPDADNLDQVEVEVAGAGFSVETGDDPVAVLRGLAPSVSVVPLETWAEPMLGLSGKTVFSAEHTGASRLEMFHSSPSGPVDRLRAEVGFRRLGRKLLRLAERGDGIQLTGEVAWAAYSSRSPKPVRLYDNRVRAAAVARAREHRERPRPGPLRLGFSGRMTAIKGPRFALEAHRGLVERGVDATLVLFGDGPERGELEALAGEGVTFAGTLDFEHEWCRAVNSSVDLMLLPHTQSDPAGTYLESAGMGVPIVGFDNQALRHLADVGGFAWTVPVRDTTAMVDVLEDLSTDLAARRKASDAAFDFMQEHCFERDFDRRVAHLLDVLGEG